MSQHWDVIVVGGGMVGAAAALGLAQQSLKVLILEREPIATAFSAEQPFGIRVSALTRASENILRNLGAWSGIEQRRLHPFKSMYVWEQNSKASVRFSSDEIGEDNLGYTVENDLIQAALWEQIAQQPLIEARYGVSLNQVNYDETTQQSSLITQSGDVLCAQLILAADGAFSKVRQLASIGLDSHDYQMCTVVGCVKTEYSHQDTCWQRYTQEGPFAFLSMANGYSSIAWYLPLEKMQWALALDQQSFIDEIEQASAGQLGRVLEVGERGAFPLVRRHALQYVKPGVALIGDSAHTINPQAGQGVNLGFLDVAALLDVIALAKQKNISLGNLGVLRKYERRRRGDNALIQRSMEMFDWMFEQQDSIKSAVRPSLLALAHQWQTPKAWLTEQTLQGRGDLPTLAQRIS